MEPAALLYPAERRERRFPLDEFVQLLEVIFLWGQRLRIEQPAGNTDCLLRLFFVLERFVLGRMRQPFVQDHLVRLANRRDERFQVVVVLGWIGQTVGFGRYGQARECDQGRCIAHGGVLGDRLLETPAREWVGRDADQVPQGQNVPRPRRFGDNERLARRRQCGGTCVRNAERRVARKLHVERDERVGGQDRENIVRVHGLLRREMSPASIYPIAARVAATNPSISLLVRFSVTATITVSFRSGYHRPACSPAKYPRACNFFSTAGTSPRTLSANSLKNGRSNAGDTPGTLANSSAA